MNEATSTPPNASNESAENLHASAGRSSFKTFALVQSLVAAGVVHAHAADAQPASRADARNEKLPDVVVEDTPAPAASSPKFTQPLRDLPQTITVINREVIDQQGATTLREILRNTPGITFQAGEGGTPAGDQMTIRGFSARTDLFIDGFRDIGGYARDSFNLEQVEVIKGPASALTGRGSTGGSINLISKTPKADAFQAGTVGIGTDNYKRATVDINQPIAESPVAGTSLRLNAMWQDSEVPGRDIVENSSWAVAPSLSLGLGSPTRATLSYVHLEQDNVPDYGIPWVPVTNVPLAAYAGEAPPVDYANFYGLTARDYEKVHNDVATLQLEQDLGTDFTLRNASRFGRTARDSIITAPRFVSTASTDIRRDDWKSRDQVDKILANHTNLTGSFDTGPLTHDISTGIEVSHEGSKNFTRTETGPDSPAADLYEPDPADPYTEAIARNGHYTKGYADSVALYAFDTVKFGEHWQVTSGIRWDRVDVHYTATNPTAPNPSKLRRVDEELTWKGGLIYKPTAGSSVYAAYGTSFNPSGESLSLTAATADIDPEKSRTYEVGTKWDLDRRLSLSAALFRSEKTNARTPGLNSSDPATVLQGEQRIDGVEVGVSGNLTRHWTAFAGYVYMDSEIEKSNTPAEVGNHLALTPRNTFNAWTHYEFPAGFSLGAGAQFMDTVYRNATNVGTAPSYWLFNATAACEVNKNLTLRLNVNNLADERYADRVGGGHFIPGPTRSAVLTAEFSF